MAALTMKITTRTPPVRIAARHMMALTALPAEHAGYLLRWGLRHYADGHGVPVAEARLEARMDERAWAIMMETARDLIDPRALSAGFIVVAPFDEARNELARVSASRIRQPAKMVAAVAGGTTVPIRAPAVPRQKIEVENKPASTVVRSDVAPAGPWDRVAAALLGRDVSVDEVNASIESWKRNHVPGEVLDAISLLEGRRIAKPVRYLDKILSNALSERRQAMPTQIRLANAGPMVPRGVKRRIKVPPRAKWIMEGWTARGHQHGGVTVEDRREVWRNDSGGLSYKRPDNIENIPSYEEDPGVYETD